MAKPTVYKKILAGLISIALFVPFFSPFMAPHAQAAISDWYKGATMLPTSTTDFASDNFKQSLRNLKATGANTVSLVVPYYQSSTGSTDIQRGNNTPTDAALASAIDYAHSLGMQVVIKVHNEVWDGSWRAYINPGDRDGWFRADAALLVPLARLAQAHRVEVMVLGVEMVGMATNAINSTNTQKWADLIGQVRAVYTGKLTYGANANDNSDSPYINEKRYIGFWSYLDYVGLSLYVGLNSYNDVASLKSGWDYWNTNDLRAFAQSTGKQIFVTEIGYRSVEGAHYDPWNWGRGGPEDQTEQANDYEAFLSYWNDYSYIAGVLFWDWQTDPNAGWGGTGYTPQHKKAETVMTRYFTNPPAGNGGGSTAGTGAPAFTADGFSDPSGTTVGNTVTLHASVRNAGGLFSNGIVDFEVYDQSGARVSQTFYEGQSFNPGESREFSATFSPQAAGTYKVKFGIFTTGWASAKYWSDSLFSLTAASAPNNPPPPPPPTGTTTPPSAGTVEIWWPTNGSTVTGTQPFKAILQNNDTASYQMFWQVDGGTLNQMYNSTVDYPHKEAMVDVSGWHWQSSNSYSLNFVAKNSGGAVLGQKSVNIRTQ